MGGLHDELSRMDRLRTVASQFRANEVDELVAPDGLKRSLVHSGPLTKQTKMGKLSRTYFYSRMDHC